MLDEEWTYWYRTTMQADDRLRWRARLKKDINLISKVFRRGTVVTLVKNVRGHVHIEGYTAATVTADDWELVIDQHKLDEILSGN